MPAIRTFLDAGILITAFRGSGDAALVAQNLVDDPGRAFIASDVLRLELIPKSAYHGHFLERQFYEAYFAAAEVVETTPALVQSAEREATSCGLSAADALHVAAAIAAGAAELVTTEGQTKPLHRVMKLPVKSLA